MLRLAASRLRWVARLAVGLLLAAGVVGLAASPASAATCSYDTANRLATVTLGSGDGTVVIRANGSHLEVADAFCALLTEVNTVTINAAGDADAKLHFDLRNGPLGPGNFNEGNGSSEIEFTVNGLTAQSLVRVSGGSDPDKITLGWFLDRFTGYSAGQMNLNGFADAGTVDNDISFPTPPGAIQVESFFGDDVISGAGTGTVFTGPISVPLSLDGGQGSDQLAGGNGDDLIVFGELATGSDTLTGGPGYDQLLAVNDQPEIGWYSISLDGVANDGLYCPGVNCTADNVGNDFEVVIGSGADETIVGNAEGQYLTGSGGNDLVQGLGGSDTFGCDAGTYEGGRGADVFEIFGEECGIVRGGKGKDTADFHNMQQAVVVSLDNVSNDGPAGHATANVRSDVERVIGSSYDDTLTGNGDADQLQGLAGNDTLLGGDGPDALAPGPGVDTVDGGAGKDKLIYSASNSGVVVQMAAKLVTGEGDDAFASVEAIVGSRWGDTMNGAGSADRFIGGAGNDVLKGFRGADTLLGGDGDDSIDGGKGTDTCSQGAGVGTVVRCE